METILVKTLGGSAKADPGPGWSALVLAEVAPKGQGPPWGECKYNTQRRGFKLA